MSDMICTHCRLDTAGNHQPDCVCLQVGKVELQPSVTYKSCPDCERLKALLTNVWQYISREPDCGIISQEDFDELESRIKAEGIK